MSTNTFCNETVQQVFLVIRMRLFVEVIFDVVEVMRDEQNMGIRIE